MCVYLEKLRLFSKYFNPLGSWSNADLLFVAIVAFQAEIRFSSCFRSHVSTRDWSFAISTFIAVPFCMPNLTSSSFR